MFEDIQDTNFVGAIEANVAGYPIEEDRGQS